MVWAFALPTLPAHFVRIRYLRFGHRAWSEDVTHDLIFWWREMAILAVWIQQGSLERRDPWQTHVQLCKYSRLHSWLTWAAVLFECLARDVWILVQSRIYSPSQAEFIAKFSIRHPADPNFQSTFTASNIASRLLKLSTAVADFLWKLYAKRWSVDTVS